MSIIVQTIGGDEYVLKGEIEIPNKTLANITRALLLKSSHKEELWCLAYQYAICLSLRTDNWFRGNVPYFLCHGSRPAYRHIII